MAFFNGGDYGISMTSKYEIAEISETGQGD